MSKAVNGNYKYIFFAFPFAPIAQKKLKQQLCFYDFPSGEKMKRLIMVSEEKVWRHSRFTSRFVRNTYIKAAKVI